MSDSVVVVQWVSEWCEDDEGGGGDDKSPSLIVRDQIRRRDLFVNLRPGF